MASSGLTPPGHIKSGLYNSTTSILCDEQTDTLPERRWISQFSEHCYILGKIWHSSHQGSTSSVSRWKFYGCLQPGLRHQYGELANSGNLVLIRQPPLSFSGVESSVFGSSTPGSAVVRPPGIIATDNTRVGALSTSRGKRSFTCCCRPIFVVGQPQYSVKSQTYSGPPK